jgi:NTP pyrophosphatase (non-canonical NTP hydrolase)
METTTMSDTMPERFDLNRYQQEAARTGGSDLKPENREKGIQCAALGLCGEAGEVADLIKKAVHHRAPMNEAALKKEAGDVLWYLAHLCNVMEWDLRDVAEGNVAKLRTRYPDGFNTADSITRRDVAPAAQWQTSDPHGTVEVSVRLPR